MSVGPMYFFNLFNWGSLTPNFLKLNLTLFYGAGNLLMFSVFFLLLLICFGIVFLYSTFFSKNKSLSIQNIGNFSDIFVFILLGLAFFLSFFFYSLLLFDSSYFYIMTGSTLGFIVTYIINVIFVIGIYFCIYIKGSGQGSFMMYNFILDIINISSYCMRFFIQLVRIIIVICTIIMFSLLFMEVFFWTSFSSFLDILFLYVHILFEVFHSIFIIFIQCSVFSFILLWLFQFLIYSYNIFLLENLYVG